MDRADGRLDLQPLDPGPRRDLGKPPGDIGGKPRDAAEDSPGEHGRKRIATHLQTADDRSGG